jgi:hypothetical protein
MLTPLYHDLPASGARVRTIHEAVREFIAGLPNGSADYREAVHDCALALYRLVSDPTATYFVDKSPMYHLIVDEIVSTFPEARFLFLFRNPLSVIASCVELFDSGKWEVSRYHAALFESFAYLAPACIRYASTSVTIRFEDLVTGDEAPWRRILDYLGLPWDPLVIKQFHNVELHGRLGDPTGVVAYAALSQEPLEKWRSTLGNPVRRAWCARYLQWLGRERLEAMGYDLDELQRELSRIPVSLDRILEDSQLMAASVIRELVKARLPPSSSRASTWRALLSV